MVRNCALIPQVKNDKGQLVDSKLFKSLLAYTGNNRSQAVKLYLITKSEEFIKNWNPRLTLDENNEPTLKSLLEKTKLKDVIPESQILERLNREIGYYKRGMDRPALWIDSDENYQKLVRKAIQFNQTSNFKDNYVARVIKIDDRESHRSFLGVKVFKRNKAYSIEADKMAYNTALNDRLRDILSSKGITTGALTTLEKRMGINGVTDFDTARTAANGFIELIRLAEGIKGEQALPEEFAHFALEAMEGSPLVNRLVNNLNSSGLVDEILGEEYETYNTLYNGDSAKLAKEAAGKLLAKHLLRSEPIGSKPYRNLLERVINAIKSFFKALNASQIQKAIYEADRDFSKLARDILTGEIDKEIDIKNINSSGLYYQTNERVQRDRKLLQKIIDNEAKRLKIYEKRNPNSKFDSNQRLLINQLELNLINNNEIEGIYDFVDNTLSELQKVKNRLETLKSPSTVSFKEKASVLRDARNYIYSYKNITENIREALLEEEEYSDNRYGERVRVALDKTSTLIDDLFIQYNKISIPLFVDFIKSFMGEGIKAPLAKFKGKVLKPEDLVKMAENDISFFDRWLDSMADSSEPLLKVMDQAVKKSKELARLRVIEIKKQLEAATIELEQAGIKDTGWMFERDSSGNLSGNYISRINQSLFKERMGDMLKTLRDKYGDNPFGKDAESYRRERQQWFDANMEIVDGIRQPKMSIYESKQYRDLNSAQRRYYNTVMDIKSKLDSYLPEKYIKPFSAVKIRKDLLERIKSSEGVISGATQIWESIKDAFIRRADDVDFGSKAAMKDFEGNEVQMLPIYYTKLKKGESANDISTDIVSTLTAYASMAVDFDEMNKVIDVLELGRDVMREREVVQTQGEKPLVERFKIMGRKIENKLTKEGASTRTMQRLDDFFKMQVYGRYMDDEGTFGNTRIDKAKSANLVNKITSINRMAVNILLGISNVVTGDIMMRIEAFAGEFFNVSNTLKADRNYGRALPEFLAELGNRIKTSKLALWDEKFNVMQDYEQDIRELNFDRKTWVSRLFSTGTLFAISNAGEHWMQNRTSLALADAYKMKSPNGKIVSLWDAMEVVPIDKNNKSLGAKLQLKGGYTKADGSLFTEEDVIAFSRKAAAINQRMHGIYNKADRSAIQRTALGRMAIMFRKWVKPSLNRRFKSASYNMDLQQWAEGYYLTTGRFLSQVANDLRSAQFNISSNWNNLSKTEKANIRRAITEVAHYVAVVAVLGMVDWDSDKDRPWLARMVEYQLRRLKTEIGVLVPGKPMVDEGLKIVKSPAAAIETIQSTLDLIGLINPMNYETFAGENAIYKSGMYEGKSKAYRLFMKSPLVPMRSTIIKGIDPELAIPYFK